MIGDKGFMSKKLFLPTNEIIMVNLTFLEIIYFQISYLGTWPSGSESEKKKDTKGKYLFERESHPKGKFDCM